MRPYCIFIVCLVLFTFCSLTQSEFRKGADKCCFSFSNVKIPVKQVKSHHTTHLECHRSGVIVITKTQREICVDPSERWVQRLMNLVDARHMKEMSQSSSGDSDSKPERKASDSVRTSETIPLHRSEETTLVLFKESQGWKVLKSVRTSETTPLHQPEEETTLVLSKELQDWKVSESVRTADTTLLHQPEVTTPVHLKESHDRKASESVRTIETTPLHRLEEMTVVHFEESHDRFTHFCMQPG